MWFDFAGNSNAACCLDKLKVVVGKCVTKDGAWDSEWLVVESLMSASCNIFRIRCVDAGNPLSVRFCISPCLHSANKLYDVYAM